MSENIADAAPKPPLIVVMGVSGSGKSTIGTALAARLGVDFIDGDDLHPRANVEKMRAGHPLTDDDRWPWLARVGRALAEAESRGLVIACSALKREYRDAITAEAPGVLFVELTASRSTLEERVSDRHGHFMPASLLDSQLATLEELAPDEHGVVVDVTPRPDAVVAAAVERIRRASATM